MINEYVRVCKIGSGSYGKVVSVKLIVLKCYILQKHPAMLIFFFWQLRFYIEAP